MQENIVTQVSHTEKIGELMGALSKAQSKMQTAKKSSINPFFKSNYADLCAVMEVSREPLSSNGLAVVQFVDGEADKMILVTMLGHSSGEWIKSKIPLKPAKQDPQTLGSHITYMRRYAYMAIVGICAENEDDDGEAATNALGQRPPPKPKEPPQPDFTSGEVDSWLESTWGTESDRFRKFMLGVMKDGKLNNRQCIVLFEKNQKYTQDSYNNWKIKNA
jgi:hypothetical protein